ncbi:MAG: type II CRISPR-associated endonuclease Cas1 [Prevotellaceae bacterium]|nr:type II CRISPR-associated endonuclease Cas1 [Prevotellaceae bacterium]
MIKQTLFFSTPVSLSLKYNQIVIRFEDADKTVTRAIEDVGVVIVENQMVRLTVPLLNALTSNNVAVVFCDSKFMPSSMLMPLDANAVQQEVQRFQVDASLPTKKRIWKEIVECKIRNQASLLDILGRDGSVLKPYWSNVLSGDSDNREGAAAKVYWKQMYGQGFVRDRDGDAPNSLLNYGYAILRAAVARALLGSGLYPGFGLFHRNRYNAFPLADDVMEPYRPFVDYVVTQVFESSPEARLDKDTKMMIAGVLTSDVRMGGQTHPLQVALSSTTASLVRALKDKSESIVYPTFA